MKTKTKKVKALAILERNGGILFIGGCDMDTINLNHLEIFPMKRDANKGAKDPEYPELGKCLDVVPVQITYQLPNKK